MNKKFLFFVLFIFLLIIYAFEIDKTVLKGLNNINNSFKSYWVNSYISVQNFIDQYFNQEKTIKELREENSKLKYTNIFLQKELYKKNTKVPNEETFEEVYVLSYVEFDDFTSVWLDYSTPYQDFMGLIYAGNVAGIAKIKDNKVIGYLNGNKLCNYTVYVGNTKAPAIIHSIKNSQNLLAKYIPLWSDIKEGDQVITSGLDNIFFEGLSVGKVIKINKKPEALEAVIEPSVSVLNKKQFYIYFPKKISNEP